MFGGNSVVLCVAYCRGELNMVKNVIRVKCCELEIYIDTRCFNISCSSLGRSSKIICVWFEGFGAKN